VGGVGRGGARVSGWGAGVNGVAQLLGSQEVFDVYCIHVALRFGYIEEMWRTNWNWR
jgi:hypothetical protein